jgi:hypothetical protein
MRALKPGIIYGDPWHDFANNGLDGEHFGELLASFGGAWQPAAGRGFG